MSGAVRCESDVYPGGGRIEVIGIAGVGGTAWAR